MESSVKRNNSETLSEIFKNSSNTVTLSLKDYEEIKSVFDENENLDKENGELYEQLSNITKIFVKAQIPESTFNKIKEGKAKITCDVVRDVVDSARCTYVIYINDDIPEEFNSKL